MDAPLAAALALLVAFSVIAGALGRRNARGGRTGAAHERSSALLGATHGASMVLGALCPWLGVGALPLGVEVGWAAVVAMLAAFALQVRAMTTLGAWFTLSLAADPDQPVVDRGPYRWVRHPGYLGQLAMWLAFGVATRNAIALGVIAVAAPLAYAFRIRVEERMLVGALADRYESYAKGRARLLPGIW